MSMYKTFSTDKNMETDGVWLDYGSFRIKCAAAGQGNKAYVNYAEKKLKPVRRALDTGTLGNERSKVLMINIYIKTIIKEWQVKGEEKGAKWKPGMHDKNDKVIDFTEENVERALIALPSLFTDIQEQAASMSNYQHEDLDADSGNS